MKTLLTLFLLSTILCSCGISTEYLNNALIKAGLKSIDDLI